MSTSKRPGVERRGPNTYRIGFQLPAAIDPKRKWIRETRTYPVTLTEAQQLDLAEADLRALKAKHLQLRTTVDLDDIPAPGEITIAQICQLWMETQRKSPDYDKTSQSLIDNHILPHLGDMAVSQLSPLRIAHWTTLLANKPSRRGKGTLSDKTVRHVYVTLATVCNWAVEHELITVSPMAKTHTPKARRTRPRFLDDDQAVELLRQLAHEEDLGFRCSVLLALFCGLRLSEVCGLTWSDVNWGKATIDVTKAVKQTPKTGRIVDVTKTDESLRILAVPAALMTLLDETRKQQLEHRELLGDRWRDHDLIVCNFDGSPLNKDTPSRRWKRYADKHGFSGVTFHNLRTSHCTILISSSIDVVAVAGRMGHADAATTLKYYAMVVAKRDKESAKVMDEIAQRAGVRGHMDDMSVHSYEVEEHQGATVMTITLHGPDSAPT